jgi:hypothetical protein
MQGLQQTDTTSPGLSQQIQQWQDSISAQLALASGAAGAGGAGFAVSKVPLWGVSNDSMPNAYTSKLPLPLHPNLGWHGAENSPVGGSGGALGDADAARQTALSNLVPAFTPDLTRAQLEAAWLSGDGGGLDRSQLGIFPTAGSAAVGSGLLSADAGQGTAMAASGANQRRKILKHSQACLPCARSKLRCDGSRPCARCMQRGAADECRNQARGMPPSSASPTEQASRTAIEHSGAKPGGAKILKHSQACLQCRSKKVRCDGERPCRRYLSEHHREEPQRGTRSRHKHTGTHTRTLRWRAANDLAQVRRGAACSS